MYKASKRSKENLKGVDERLVLLVGYALAISKVDFVVVEGLRSTERQKQLYREKKSKCDGVTNISKHQEGKAIDVYYVGWKNSGVPDDERWKKLIETFKLAGKNLNLKLNFGYDWGWDNPHIELREHRR